MGSNTSTTWKTVTSRLGRIVLVLLFSASSSSVANDTGGTTHTQCIGETTCPPPEASSSSSTSTNASLILERILAEDYDRLDDGDGVLVRSVAVLKERGAHRCWHKHSTFLDHLLGVHNTLRLRGQGSVIGRVGLFHSAYSNSYVNLALFDPANEREVMRELIGEEAEELVHLFCIIDRQQVVVNTLLKQGFIPKEGLYVPHLRNPEEQVFLSAETLRLLVVFSMADTSDQHFSWQDSLFGGGGDDGSMIIPGRDYPPRHDSKALWPGLSKPGLWMNYVSELGRVARTFDPTWTQQNSPSAPPKVRDPSRTLDVPPVFDNCTRSITVQDEARARDLYWSVVSGEIVDDDAVMARLLLSHETNPWIFEPLVLLAQKLLHRNDFAGAEHVAAHALALEQQWGCAWDKRMSFSAWMAWTRVLHQRAQDRNPWPTNAWHVNNLGLVR